MAIKWQDEREAVRFPEWGEVLTQLKIGDEAKESVRHGVYAYLRWCKQKKTFACIATAKIYISEIEATGKNPGRPALRWFFGAAWDAKYGPSRAKHDSVSVQPLKESVRLEVAGAKIAEAGAVVGADVSERRPYLSESDRGSRGMEPGQASKDLGANDWEHKLVEAARRRAFSWRTEETYRGWAVRFAKFIEPRTPWVADAADVQAFLTDMAVQWRASASTQKQALRVKGFAHAV
jgi:hypothetical protein